MEDELNPVELIASDLASVLATVRPQALGDDALLVSTERVEALGRIVDAARVAHAAEIAERSRVEHGSERLSARKGCRNANELLQRITRASGATVERRMRLGLQTRRNQSITGVEFPARFDLVASALEAGRIGVDAAQAIVAALTPALARAGIDEIAAAERELVAAAIGESEASAVPGTADDIRGQAQVWQVVLDPDGVEPIEVRAMNRRGLRLGREHDGVVKLEGVLVAEVAARLRTAIDSYLNPRTGTVSFVVPGVEGPLQGTDADSAVGINADAAVARDPRTLGQQRHDILAAMIDAAVRSGELPSIGGAAPTVLVSVRAEDLADGTGAGWIDGCEVPLSMRAVTQFACAGGIQKVFLNSEGAVMALGSPERCFTPQQRRAISVRDGGCVIPGCQVPAAWCEVHHVEPHSAGGATHTSNGALLCWSHHRTIDTSGWEISMRGGVPWIKPPPWMIRDPRWRPASGSRARLFGSKAWRRE